MAYAPSQLLGDYIFDKRTIHPGAVSLTGVVSARRGLPARRASSAHDVAPLGQCGRATFAVGLTVDEVTFLVEVVVDLGVDGAELLERLHPSEPEHCPLSSSEWRVGILGPVVQPPAGFLALGVANLLHRRAV